MLKVGLKLFEEPEHALFLLTAYSYYVVQVKSLTVVV